MSAGEQGLRIDCDDTPRRTQLDVIKGQLAEAGVDPLWGTHTATCRPSCPSWGNGCRAWPTAPKRKPCAPAVGGLMVALSSLEAP